MEGIGRQIIAEQGKQIRVSGNNIVLSAHLDGDSISLFLKPGGCIVQDIKNRYGLMFRFFMPQGGQFHQLLVHVAQPADFPGHTVGDPHLFFRRKITLQEARITEQGRQRRAHFMGKGIQQGLPGFTFFPECEPFHPGTGTEGTD